MMFSTKERRKSQNLKRNFEKAQKRINKKIYSRCNELMRDPEFMMKIDGEILGLSSDEMVDYLSSDAYELSKEETEDEMED
jgi:hypothetical protein